VSDYKELGLSCFGPATFLKAPLVETGGDWRADIAALGVPFDQGTGFRTGSRWGSRAIRNISMRYSSLSSPGARGYWDLRTKLTKATCSFVDCGDVDIVPLLWEKNFEAITSSVREILDHKALPFTFGGDHSITLPVLRAFEGSGPITIVHFDAHMDYRDEALEVRYGHGNVMRRVNELPHVEKTVSIGIRGPRIRRNEYEDNIAAGNVVIPAWDVHEKGLAKLRDMLPSRKHVYVSFDVDVMDPGIAPGTGTPEVGGLSFEQARAFLEIVCQNNAVVGFDVVELNPMLDQAEITALLAVQISIEVAGFMFQR
jgi:agmatinase